MRNSRLLLPLAAASATAGITAAAYFPAIFLFFLFLLIILIKTRHTFLTFVCFFSFLLFFSLYAVTDSQNVSSYQQGTYQFKAVIDTIPKIDGDRMSMMVKTPDSETWAAAYRIQSADEKERLLYIEPGMSCELTGTLEEPRHATVPNTFDYNEYLYRQHIHWNYSVTSIQNCSEPEHFKYKVLSLRKYIISFTNSLLPPDSAGIVQALTVGDRFYVEDEVLTAYQKLGVVHLLAISGLHFWDFNSGFVFYHDSSRYNQRKGVSYVAIISAALCDVDRRCSFSASRRFNVRCLFSWKSRQMACPLGNGNLPFIHFLTALQSLSSL